MEDYLRARELAGTGSLAAMAEEYGRMFRQVVKRALVPKIVAELIRMREQDGASKVHVGQLRTTLNRFAAKFPGPILEVAGPDIDGWLRSLDVAPGTRNSMLRCVKVLFSFAKSRNHLPEEQNTAVEQIQLVRVKLGRCGDLHARGDDPASPRGPAAAQGEGGTHPATAPGSDGPRPRTGPRLAAQCAEAFVLFLPPRPSPKRWRRTPEAVLAELEKKSE